MHDFSFVVITLASRQLFEPLVSKLFVSNRSIFSGCMHLLSYELMSSTCMVAFMECYNINILASYTPYIP